MSAKTIAHMRRRYPSLQERLTGEDSALVHRLDDGGFLLVTDISGLRAPTNKGHKVLVGRYDKGGAISTGDGRSLVLPISKLDTWIGSQLGLKISRLDSWLDVTAYAVQRAVWWFGDSSGAQFVLGFAGLSGLLLLAHYWAWPRHPVSAGISLGLLIGGVRRTWFTGGQGGKGFLWLGVVLMLSLSAGDWESMP
jgi:hypothetical protein